MNSADLLYLNKSRLHLNLDCLRTTPLFRDDQVNVLLIRAQLKAALKEKTFGLKELPTSPKTFCKGVDFYTASLLTCVELEVFLGEPTTKFCVESVPRRFWHKLCGENKEEQAHIFVRFPNVGRRSSQGNACNFFHEHCL